VLRAATANADAAMRIVDGDPDTVGTAVAARSLASAIPGAVGVTPAGWRNVERRSVSRRALPLRCQIGVCPTVHRG